MKYVGIVQKGERRGSALGFPTANISYDGMCGGIFAAEAILGGKKYFAAVYADTRRKILETHLQGFSGEDTYGKEISVELLTKIREDMHFDSEADLKAAIANDIVDVRKYFETRPA